MTLLTFENFSFRWKDDLHETVIVDYATRYFFELSISELANIDKDVSFSQKTVEFPNTSEKSAERKFDQLLDRGLKNLKHKINKKDVVYIDELSGIPLIGSGEFGIIDRNTSIIELKPSTGCNFNCIYCSVDEGINKKTADILIDPYYLASEAAKIAKNKTHPVEFNIGPHGEPLLYPFMVELITELNKIPNCAVVSINTNGSFLYKELLDDLKKAGLSRINLSLNTLDKDVLDKLSGKAYPLSQVLKMIEYCKEINLPILIAPLIIPTINDDPIRDIEPLIKLAKTISSPFPTIGFQKFLAYKGGRNPVKEVDFDTFFDLLKPFEEKYDLVLTPKADYNPFGIYEDTKLEKPILKGDVLKAQVVSKGRVPNETLLVVKDRVITVRGLMTTSSTAKIKIVRDKHNIYLAIPA